MEPLFLICFSPGSLMVDVWLSVMSWPWVQMSDWGWSVVCAGVLKCAGLNSRRAQEKSAHRARGVGRCVQLEIRNTEQGEEGSPDIFKWSRWGFCSYVLICQYSGARSQEQRAMLLRSISRGILHGALGSWHILGLWKTVFLDISSVSQDDISGWRLS